MGTRIGFHRLPWLSGLCLALLAFGYGLSVGCGGKAVVDGPASGNGGSGGAGGSPSTTTTHSTTTSITNTTTATTSTTSTASSECEQACGELFACTQVDDLCPALGGADGSAFIAQCADQCAQNPVIMQLIDPQDCPGTVATLSAVSQQFDAACHGG